MNLIFFFLNFLMGIYFFGERQLIQKRALATTCNISLPIFVPAIPPFESPTISKVFFFFHSLL